ncbi:MAG: hypothetical protein L6R42_008702 [Xanthoria sp. 1 TBL-2021]|nr:MAG: hypothetical protein L6R42_008702 [Xanthoria sp. 1 TBL-2021]
MDPLSAAGFGLGAASLAFQLFAGCIKGFVLLSTAHNLGKDSSTLLCMLNLQEIKLTEWARRAGLLSGSHELDRRLNAVVVQAVLKELGTLLLDTEKLKSRYKLALNAVSLSTPMTNEPEVASAGGILSTAISEEARREIMFQAGLIHDSNGFAGRLRWAAVDKSRFEDYVSQIRLFVQELWALLDPLRQDELASGIQMVLSHVIGTSRQLEGLYALKETLQQSPTSLDPFLSSSDDSPLASAAEIKAFGMSVVTAILQPPRPLRTLLRGCPSVTVRLQLALKITQSVRYFHMAGWLHKSLQSSNILIFESGDEHRVLEPVLTGFAFSRLNSASEISEQSSSNPQLDIYRHPEAMGEPSESFTDTKDIYALGTILLEIGEWRSLSRLVEKIVDVGKGDVALSQLAKIRPFLLEDGAKGGLATLRFRMGDIYALVTKMMLCDEIPQPFAAAQGSGQMVFPNILDVAVRELSRCTV